MGSHTDLDREDDHMPDDTFWPYFYEIYEALPRQGPGERASTERALRLLPPLTAEQRILDIGCGSGAQTLDLARATKAQILAVDNHPPFVARLAERAVEAGLGDRITARVGDMHDLPFPDGSFDLVWSEGAIFIIGFARGLGEWRRLVAPGGHLVVSELCWFVDDPPAELEAIHIDGCPEAEGLDDRRRAVTEAGYRLLGDFVLPASAWWDEYYVPLQAAVDRFRAAHADDPDALAVAASCQREIDLYLKYPDAFGYVFFVMRPSDVGSSP